MSPRWSTEIIAGFHWWPAAIHFYSREAEMKRAKTGLHDSSFTGDESPCYQHVAPMGHRNIHESGQGFFVQDLYIKHLIYHYRGFYLTLVDTDFGKPVKILLRLERLPDVCEQNPILKLENAPTCRLSP